MIISKAHLLTRMEIWSPRYSDKYGKEGEWVVLLSKAKVHHASSVILIEFTKAKHLLGQRFCVTRDVAQRSPLATNGKIDCYAVKMSDLESWSTAAEERDLALSVFESL